jgi:hypothetical protein
MPHALNSLLDRITPIFSLAYYFTWAGYGVSLQTGYGLDGPGIESRWEARFSTPV